MSVRKSTRADRVGRDLVFVGVASWDTIAVVGRFPRPDERLVVDDLVGAGGGPAATAAVTAARLGAAAAFVGAVGDDDEGRRILAELQAEGVDVSGVAVAPGRSCASVVVADRSRGTRAICNRPGPDSRIDVDSAARDVVLGAAWVHVDHAGWPAVRPLLDQRRFKLSVDDGNLVEELALPAVELYVPTFGTLKRRYGPRPADDLLTAALEGGATTVVATDGANGAAAAEGGGRCWIATPDVDVVSTLGAGDVFHGALLVARWRGMTLEESVQYATVVAALSCRGVDGRSAIPDHLEAMLHLAKWRQSDSPDEEAT